MRSKFILRLLYSLIFCLFAHTMVAQSRQQQKTDSIFKLIGKHLRLKEADAIYDISAQKFRQSLTLEAFRTVANQQLFPLGEIKESALTSFLNNKTATYKVQFDVLTMEVLISLDEKDKLDLFYFRPFKVEPVNKLVDVATTNPLKTNQDKQVDSVARTYIQKLNTAGLSIGIIKNGQVSLYNYGEIAIGSYQLPTPETLFEIGSITKTFTAAILASYVNAGQIKLTDPVIKYLSDSVAANPALKFITIVNLINHTSGLPSVPFNLAMQAGYDKLNPYKNYNRQLLFSYLKNCVLTTPPGEKYAYSNLAVGLLGTILEQLSGKPFEQMVKDVVTTPLGMKSTIQHLYPMLTTRFAPVYNDDGKQTPPWDFDALASCGALRSTMNDLVLYAEANLNDDANTPFAKALKLTHELTFTKEPKLGLAWHIIVVNGVNYYFHNGGTYGSSSFLAFNKEKNLAVIILSNASASTDATGINILKKLQ